MHGLRVPFLLSLIACTSAEVKFSSPAAGASFAGGSSIKIQWADSGTAPKIADLSTYQLFLCAGGNQAGTFTQLTDITTHGDFASGNTAEGVIPAAIGGSSTNAYFLKMISVAKTGGTVINYSDRFTMTGMSGVFPASVEAGLKSVTGTAGPATENDVKKEAAVGKSAVADAGSFTVPFAMQTGPIRYAPMQKMPGTRITRKTKTPLNPTSPYTLATTFLPPASDIQSTTTQPITWANSQQTNTAAPANMPVADMQKFLARWKD